MAPHHLFNCVNHSISQCLTALEQRKWAFITQSSHSCGLYCRGLCLMGWAEEHQTHTSLWAVPPAWLLCCVVTAVTFRQVSHCWEASGDCCSSSRDGLEISLHILNSSSWWSLLKTELRWKAVMQMCHITVVLSLCFFLWYNRSTAINFKCSLHCCGAVTWNIYYFICFMPSEISLNLSLETLFSSEEGVYLQKLLSSNSVFSAGVDYVH